jgi:hypothetical protein
LIIRSPKSRKKKTLEQLEEEEKKQKHTRTGAKLKWSLPPSLIHVDSFSSFAV